MLGALPCAGLEQLWEGGLCFQQLLMPSFTPQLVGVGLCYQLGDSPVPMPTGEGMHRGLVLDCCRGGGGTCFPPQVSQQLGEREVNYRSLGAEITASHLFL